MFKTLIVPLAAALAGALTTTAHAPTSTTQSTSTTQAPITRAPIIRASTSQTPTTRILAIGTITPGANLQQVKAILPREVRATAQLYLDGKIDQWFSEEGRNGVVFILNVTDPRAAQEMLEALPLGQAHLMTFALTPLGPLNPLRQLLASPAPAQ